jgi:hypothetical protein
MFIIEGFITMSDTLRKSCLPLPILTEPFSATATGQLFWLELGLFWRGPLILPLVVYAFGSLLQLFRFLEPGHCKDSTKEPPRGPCLFPTPRLAPLPGHSDPNKLWYTDCLSLRPATHARIACVATVSVHGLCACCCAGSVREHSTDSCRTTCAVNAVVLCPCLILALASFHTPVHACTRVHAWKVCTLECDKTSLVYSHALSSQRCHWSSTTTDN